MYQALFWEKFFLISRLCFSDTARYGPTLPETVPIAQIYLCWLQHTGVHIEGGIAYRGTHRRGYRRSMLPFRGWMDHQIFNKWQLGLIPPSRFLSTTVSLPLPPSSDTPRSGTPQNNTTCKASGFLTLAELSTEALSTICLRPLLRKLPRSAEITERECCYRMHLCLCTCACVVSTSVLLFARTCAFVVQAHDVFGLGQ